MSSGSQLAKNHGKPVPAVMRSLFFSICLGVLFVLCLLYFTDMTNKGVLSPKQPPKLPSSEIKRRMQDFRHEWLRQRRARVDWKNIIKPCADNMAWGLVKNHWGRTNISNATTSDIIFKDIRPAGEFSKIFIQSKTSDNRAKLIGGAPGGFTYVAQQALRPLFSITIMELTKLYFSSRSLVSIN